MGMAECTSEEQEANLVLHNYCTDDVVHVAAARLAQVFPVVLVLSSHFV